MWNAENRTLEVTAGSTALERAREASAALRAAGVKITQKNPVERRADLPSSLHRAVSARCWQCEGDEDAGIRWRIGNCLVSDFALHARMRRSRGGRSPMGSAEAFAPQPAPGAGC